MKRWTIKTLPMETIRRSNFWKNEKIETFVVGSGLWYQHFDWTKFLIIYTFTTNVSKEIICTLEVPKENLTYVVTSHSFCFGEIWLLWTCWTLQNWILKADLPPDCDQTFVFRNGKWQKTNMIIKSIRFCLLFYTVFCSFVFITVPFWGIA